jgi:tetratricopeptide (TPR) repeat protein
VGSHIFISHSSKDRKIAQTICTALENRGLACWIYSRNIEPGQNFQEQIVKAIRAAKIMILVFTANANNSNEIKKELALASQNNLVVIPVRIEDVIPNEAFTYEFATRQWIDLFVDWESSITRLADLIAAARDGERSADQAQVGSGSLSDGPTPSIGKIAKAGLSLENGGASFMQRPTLRWAMISGIAVFAIVVVAAITYEGAALRQQPASGSGTVTDCDRLAALPGDPQVPPSVHGVLQPFQIDIMPALKACDEAMRQYPDVARFIYQAGRVALAQNDFVKARQLYEKAAASGSNGAMNGLGYLYQNGFGVPKSDAEARKWYEMAAGLGNPTAAANLRSLLQQ